MYHKSTSCGPEHFRQEDGKEKLGDSEDDEEMYLRDLYLRVSVIS